MNIKRKGREGLSVRLSHLYKFETTAAWKNVEKKRKESKVAWKRGRGKEVEETNNIIISICSLV